MTCEPDWVDIETKKTEIVATLSGWTTKGTAQPLRNTSRTHPFGGTDPRLVTELNGIPWLASPG